MKYKSEDFAAMTSEESLVKALTAIANELAIINKQMEELK